MRNKQSQSSVLCLGGFEYLLKKFHRSLYVDFHERILAFELRFGIAQIFNRGRENSQRGEKFVGQTGEHHVHLSFLPQFGIALIKPHNKNYCYDKGKNQYFYDIY